MTLWQRILLFFKGKSYFLRIRINYPDKYTKVVYVKRRGLTEFTVEDDDNTGVYIVEPEKIYDEDGFRTLSYNLKDPVPIDYQDFEREVSTLTAQRLHSGREQKITDAIIAAQREDDENKMMKRVSILLFVVLGGLFAVAYLVYDGFEQMQTVIDEQREIIESLREIIRGG